MADDRLGDGREGDPVGLPPPDELEALAEQLGQEADRPPDLQVPPERLETVAAEVYGTDRRLAALGECRLMVSADGLTAFLRGRPPAATTHADLARMLAAAGVVFGVMPGRLYDVLPRRGRRRERRGRAPRDPTADVVVARGEAPTDPGSARVEPLVPMPPPEVFTGLRQALEGTDPQALRRLRLTAPFVRAGQGLVRVRRQPARPGRDVLGQVLPPADPPGADLRAGDHAEVDAQGVCRAEAAGYAGIVDGVVDVLSPVWVSKDLMSAYWVHFEGGDLPTRKDIRRCLKAEGIAHGVDREAVAGLAAALRKGGAERLTLLARGTPARPGSGGGWRFPIDPKETRYAVEFERVLGRARTPAYLNSYCKGLAAWTAKAGQVLASRQAPETGEQGIDVFGEQFTPEEPREERLRAGAHVDMIEDQRCCSQVYGVVCVEGDQVRVAVPLWVDPAGGEAWLVNLPQLGPACHPEPEQIEALLAAAGVVYGVRHEAVAVLCEKIRQSMPVDLVTCVARGEPARPGVDGRFETAFEPPPRTGRFREDGSVDFRALNLRHLLQANDLIGVRVPPRPGVRGTDLYGRPIDVEDGTPVPVEAVRGVRRTEGEDGVVWYQAEIDGELVFDDRREGVTRAVFLSVLPVLVIRGDVCYDTGNIDYPGCVDVRGCVRPDFEVHAGGNITVADSVEDGAILEAGGSVAVTHGILGERTQVRAARSVYAKFVQDSRVEAGDEVVVCEYVRRGRIQCDGRVVVAGRAGNRRSGAIIGGRIIAGVEIRACSAGIDGGDVTMLVAGTRPSALRRLNELARVVARAEGVVERMTLALQVSGTDPSRLRALLVAMLARASGARRQALGMAIKTLMRMQARLDEARREQRELLEMVRLTPLEGRVAISGAVASSTLIRIGEQTLRAGRDAAQVADVVFRLHRGRGGRVQLRMVPNGAS